MATDIGPKIGVQGEAEFRKSITDINNNIKTLAAETKAVTSAFIGEEKSMEALSSKNELLASRSEALNQKLDLQKARLKELDDQGVDPTSAKYQKLLQDLYKTETELNQNEAEIKQNEEAMQNLANGVDEAGDEVEDLGDKSAKTGDLLKANLASQAIVAGVKALASAIMEGAKALGEMVVNAAYAADDLNTMAKTTGLSTEELQKFQYASDLIDVSLDTLTGSMTKLTKNMASAQSGSGAAAEAFKRLGVSVVDGNGDLRDRNEVFNETIAALGQITNETERDAVAMNLFGKSAQDLNPLIMGGADALQQLGDEAEAAGLIMSQDTLDSLNGVSDAMDKFKATTGAAKNILVSAFAGPAADAINTLTGYITKLVSAFQNNDWDSIGDIIQEVLDDLVEKLNEFLPKAIEFGLNIIMSIAQSIIENLPTILQTAIEIIVTIVKGLTDTLPKLIPVAIEAVLTLVDALTDPDMLSELIDAALTLIIALAGGLIEALPKLIQKAPEIVANLVTAIVENAPKLLTAAFELIVTLANAIIDNLPEIAKSAGKIVVTLVDGIQSLLSQFVQVGRDILTGIWNGIGDKIEWLKGKVKGVVETIKGWFTSKDALDVNSPSKWSKGVFENVMIGATDGLKAGLPALLAEAGAVTDDVRNAMEMATVGMTPRINAPEYSARDQVADTVNGIQTALSAMPHGVTKVIFQVNGRTFAEETINDFVDVARANGTPILNPAVG